MEPPKEIKERIDKEISDIKLRLLKLRSKIIFLRKFGLLFSFLGALILTKPFIIDIASGRHFWATIEGVLILINIGMFYENWRELK